VDEDELLCSSCERQKEKLYPIKSALIGAQLYMCQSCLDQGFEPRWAIILAAQKFGMKQVTPYIVKRKYEGEQIHAYEIIG
jgi:hypothetical protein